MFADQSQESEEVLMMAVLEDSSQESQDIAGAIYASLETGDDLGKTVGNMVATALSRRSWSFLLGHWPMPCRLS